jgi:hypothetical protein
MFSTFAAYDTKLNLDLEQLPLPQLLFFGMWCTDHLYTRYAAQLIGKEEDYQQEYTILTGLISYLWAVADNPSLYELAVAEEHMRKLCDIDVAFDFTSSTDRGIMKAMEGMESVLRYLKNKEPEYIVANGHFQLDVIDVILHNDLGLTLDNENDPDRYLDHPIIKEEFDVQFKMIEYLRSHEVTSEDKRLFR